MVNHPIEITEAGVNNRTLDIVFSHVKECCGRAHTATPEPDRLIATLLAMIDDCNQVRFLVDAQTNVLTVGAATA